MMIDPVYRLDLYGLSSKLSQRQGVTHASPSRAVGIQSGRVTAIPVNSLSKRVGPAKS